MNRELFFSGSSPAILAGLSELHGGLVKRTLGI